jgi:hypothetical protein
MRYLTKEGFEEIQEAIYEAHHKNRRTVKLLTKPMLALLAELEQAERERDKARAALESVHRSQEMILGKE